MKGRRLASPGRTQRESEEELLGTDQLMDSLPLPIRDEGAIRWGKCYWARGEEHCLIKEKEYNKNVS